MAAKRSQPIISMEKARWREQSLNFQVRISERLKQNYDEQKLLRD